MYDHASLRRAFEGLNRYRDLILKGIYSESELAQRIVSATSMNHEEARELARFVKFIYDMGYEHGTKR